MCYEKSYIIIAHLVLRLISDCYLRDTIIFILHVHMYTKTIMRHGYIINAHVGFIYNQVYTVFLTPIIKERLHNYIMKCVIEYNNLGYVILHYIIFRISYNIINQHVMQAFNCAISVME